MELIGHLQPWHWFVLAIALIVLEMFSATGFFIGIAAACLVISGLLLVVPDLAWEWQFAIFGTLSVVLTIGYLKLFKKVNEQTDSPLLNDRAAQLIGTSFVLEDDLREKGAVMIGDTRWSARCQGTLAKGTRARVVSSEGMTLSLAADE